jgi:hypothetical protein
MVEFDPIHPTVLVLATVLEEGLEPTPLAPGATGSDELDVEDRGGCMFFFAVSTTTRFFGCDEEGTFGI